MSIPSNCWSFLYPFAKGYNGDITARRYLWLQHRKYYTVRGLEMFVILWYNGGNKKTTSRRSLRLAWGGRKYGVWIPTTILTIYGFGLRGNSARKSTLKQGFRIEKHHKSLKNPYFTRLFAFGTIRSHVRIVSLRPHENDPNILLFGESFGLFVLFDNPNFNSQK